MRNVIVRRSAANICKWVLWFFGRLRKWMICERTLFGSDRVLAESGVSHEKRAKIRCACVFDDSLAWKRSRPGSIPADDGCVLVRVRDDLHLRRIHTAGFTSESDASGFVNID